VYLPLKSGKEATDLSICH